MRDGGDGGHRRGYRSDRDRADRLHRDRAHRADNRNRTDRRRDHRGSWSGTWGIEGFPDAGTFSLEIEPTAGGFEGAIQIQNSECVSGGAVEIGLEGDRITFGVVQAELEISFTGTVSGDRMSGTWNDGGGCPPPHDRIWEAPRS